MAGDTTPLVDVKEHGFPAEIPMCFFVHTPATSLVIGEFVAESAIEVARVEVHPGVCGTGAGPTVIDVADDGTSIFTTGGPSIAHDDTDGTRQVFYPTSTLKTIAAGSVVTVAFAGVATGGAANFGITVWIKTFAPQG
jgi:hypothetical protein